MTQQLTLPDRAFHSGAEDDLIAALIDVGWHEPANDNADRRRWKHLDFPGVGLARQFSMLPMLRLTADFVFGMRVSRHRIRWLVVEVDGFPFHSSPWNFERDRRLDREARMVGVTMLRFPASELARRLGPEIAAAEIHEELRAWGLDVAS